MKTTISIPNTVSFLKYSYINPWWKAGLSKTGKSNFVSQDGIDSICNKMETIYGSETEKLGHIIYVVKGCLVSWASQGKNGAKPS